MNWECYLPFPMTTELMRSRLPRQSSTMHQHTRSLWFRLIAATNFQSSSQLVARYCTIFNLTFYLYYQFEILLCPNRIVICMFYFCFIQVLEVNACPLSSSFDREPCNLMNSVMNFIPYSPPHKIIYWQNFFCFCFFYFTCVAYVYVAA